MLFHLCIGIRDPGWVKNSDPGWTSQIIFLRAYKQFFGLKMRMRDLFFDSRIRDGKMVGIRDPAYFLIQVQTGKECGYASTLPFTEDIPLKRLCRKFLAVLPGWDLLSVAAFPPFWPCDELPPKRPRSDGLKLLPRTGCPGNGLPTGRPGTAGKLRSELVPDEDCSASPSRMSRALFPRNDMRKSSSCTYAQAKQKILH